MVATSISYPGCCRLAAQQTRRHLIHIRRFPALNRGVGIDTGHFADADIVIDRHLGKAVPQRSQQRGLPVAPPLLQFSPEAVELPALAGVDNVEVRFVAL